MHPLFLPRPVNGPFEDPGLFIPFQFERRALLFDLGDLSGLPPRELLKVSHVYVTHTHMDHFIGFDRLLRCRLNRAADLHLFGPAGFIANVEGKLAGYTWDLVDRWSCGLRLHVTEVRPDRLLRRSYAGAERFAPQAPPVELPSGGPLTAEAAFEVSAAVLRHSTPCLALRLAERLHVNILKTGLEALGLRPGPWLTRFKAAVYAGADPETDFEVEAGAGFAGGRFRLGELERRIARITPGQRIVYVTDVGDTPANREAIASLARGADQLFIEAAFLHEDRGRAAAKHHLTARQAGEIAALAGVGRFTVFHFSPRYEGRGEELVREARAAFERTRGEGGGAPGG